MNQLKWYDFLGALILLFSVTKSAIKPPEMIDQGNTLSASSVPTTINMDSLKTSPREATLSQMDMLSPPMSGIGTRNSIETDLQDGRLNGRNTNETNLGGEPTSKALPKTAPRVRSGPDQGKEARVALSPQAYSPVPAFIC